MKQITQNLIATPPSRFGLVHLRPNKAVNVSRAPPSRDSGVQNGVSRLNSLMKNEEKNDSVYTNSGVPSNHT